MAALFGPVGTPNPALTHGGRGPSVSSTRERESAPVVTPGTARRAAEQELGTLLDAGISALSDDEILIQVGHYTATLDGQVNEQLTGMRENARKSREISAVLNYYSARETEVDKGQHAATPVDLNQQLNVQMPDGSTRTRTVGEILAENGITPSTAHGPVMLSSLSALRDSAKSALEGIRGGGEMRQLEMQQVLSKRNQLMQVVSNVMASRSETRKSIAQNIRG
ncbi:MAG: hypothetical protein Q8Q09_24890 [Deltaproteobacteria bacterium]|nr:hypothetical protein [Deltaproteobacteria bacterium]